MFVDIMSWTLVMALPGPDIVAIGTQASRFGKKAGVLAALGAASGVAVWSVLSLLGITALLNTVPWMRSSLPIVGSLVLISLGLMSLIQARQHLLQSREAGISSAEWKSTGGAFRLGFVTNISNPKALIFFTSFFTPMMGHYPSTGMKVGILCVLLIISFLVFSSMAVLLKAASTTRLASVSFTRFIPGVVFMLIGLYYFVEHMS